jgi:hypothetical protein
VSARARLHTDPKSDHALSRLDVIVQGDSSETQKSTRYPRSKILISAQEQQQLGKTSFFVKDDATACKRSPTFYRCPKKQKYNLSCERTTNTGVAVVVFPKWYAWS